MKHFNFRSLSRLCVAAMLICIAHVAAAQKESAWWYFGWNAGTHFAVTGPVADTNGSTYAGGGVITLSDATGNLLFYSGGSEVFNRNHQVMPNGSAMMEDPSAEANMVGFPRPDHPSHYFMFTSNSPLSGASQSGGEHGLFFSVIDMTLDNGLGDVIDTLKNVQVTDSAEEKIAATRHANGIDYWVAMRKAQTGQCWMYLVTEAGVSQTPVITELGAQSSNYWDTEGGYQFSHDGTLFVHSSIDGTEIYDFDKSTGQLTNLRVINSIGTNGSHMIEFSSDDRFMYLGGPTQFDLSTPTQSAIAASEVFLATSSTAVATVQMGLDGKIYGISSGLSAGEYLGVIHQPNQAGASSNYQEFQIYLEDGHLGWSSLPMFESTLFRPNFYFEDACIDDSLWFDINFTILDSVYWEFGDPGSGTADTSTSQGPYHIYGSPGSYSVQLVAWHGVRTDTITKTVHVSGPPVIDLGPDTTVCTPITDSILLGAVTETGTYSWSTGQSDSSISVITTGTYVLTFTDVCGSDVDSIEIVAAEAPVAGLLAPDSLCVFEDTLFLDVTQPAALSYLWSDNSTAGTYSSTQTGWHSVTITGLCDSVSDSVHVVFYQCPWPDGVEDVNDNTLRIFPNPTDGQITIITREATSVQLFDASGQLMLERRLPSGTHQLDLGHLAPGAYQLRSENGYVETIVLNRP